MDARVGTLGPRRKRTQHLINAGKPACAEKIRLHVLHAVLNTTFGLGISLGTHSKIHVLLFEKRSKHSRLEYLSVYLLAYKHSVLVDNERFHPS